MSSSLNCVTQGYTKNKALVPTLKARKIPLYLPFIGRYRYPLKGCYGILGRAHMGFLIHEFSALYSITKARKGPNVGAVITGHALHVLKTVL